MKKLCMLFICAFLMGPLIGTTQTINAATVEDYAVTASVSMSAINLLFYNFPGPAVYPTGIPFVLDNAHSSSSLNDLEGNQIDYSWDWVPGDAFTSTHLSGSYYDASASTTDSSLDVSLKTNANRLQVSANQLFNFTSVESGLIKLSFSYDMTATFFDFPEDGYTSPSAHISAWEQGDNVAGGSLSCWRDLRIPFNATNGTWSVYDGIGELYMAVEANKSYFFQASASIYTDTKQPLQTPVPATVWLLGSGLMGLARIRMKA